MKAFLTYHSQILTTNFGEYSVMISERIAQPVGVIWDQQGTCAHGGYWMIWDQQVTCAHGGYWIKAQGWHVTGSGDLNKASEMFVIVVLQHRVEGVNFMVSWVAAHQRSQGEGLHRKSVHFYASLPVLRHTGIPQCALSQPPVEQAGLSFPKRSLGTIIMHISFSHIKLCAHMPQNRLWKPQFTANCNPSHHWTTVTECQHCNLGQASLIDHSALKSVSRNG